MTEVNEGAKFTRPAREAIKPLHLNRPDWPLSRIEQNDVNLAFFPATIEEIRTLVVKVLGEDRGLGQRTQLGRFSINWSEESSSHRRVSQIHFERAGSAEPTCRFIDSMHHLD